MAENARKQRAGAAALLNECIRSTERYMKTPNPSLRLLQQKLKELVEAKENLIDKQIVLAEKSSLDYESEELQEWINPKLDTANDLADTLFVKIDEMNQNKVENKAIQEMNQRQITLAEESKNEVEILTIHCERSVKIIEDRIASMNSVVNDTTRNSPVDKDLVRSYIMDIEDSLEETTKSWNKLMSYHVKDSELLKHVFDQEMGLKTSFSTHSIPAVAFCDDSPNVVSDNVTTIKTKEFLDMKKVNPSIFGSDIMDRTKIS